jgi:acyl-CoA reductase-like NAD-dependent aldehyde dehydrogenase
VKRVYAPRARYDEVVEARAARARTVMVGPGTQDGVRIGPLNNAAQRDRVAGLVDDAVSGGARVVAGGHAPDRPGFFYAPTVLADAVAGMRIVDEEQFGPALPVIAYDDVEDALAAANSSNYGLGGSVWSADLDRAEALARRLESGSAWVNTHTALAPHLPFGGLKWSGIGVEGGEWGVDAFTDVQVVHRPPRGTRP